MLRTVLRRSINLPCFIVLACSIMSFSGCGNASITTNQSNNGSQIITDANTEVPTEPPADVTDPQTTIPIITLGVARFDGNRNLLIKAGVIVQFVDPAKTGGSHVLLSGTNGTFMDQPGLPTKLTSTSGVYIQPGDTLTYTFATPGTYFITCAPHPGMLVKITVTP